MWCRGLILADRLSLEALSQEERRRAQYVEKVPAPSVITMNMLSTAFALNEFLFSFTGLHETDNLEPLRYHLLSRQFAIEERVTRRPNCLECAGRKAFGARRRPTTHPSRARGR